MDNNLSDQNKLAYLLHAQLNKAAEKFCKQHKDMTGSALIGAANLFIISYLAQVAPNRQQAHLAVDDIAKIMHNTIDKTPLWLAFGNNPNLN